MFTAPPPVARLASPYRPEIDTVTALATALAQGLDWSKAAAMAAPWVQAVRDKPAPFVRVNLPDPFEYRAEVRSPLPELH